MEKKGISLKWQDIIKYGIMLIMLGSAYGSLVSKNIQQDKDNMELKQEIKELKEAQIASAKESAEINGKQDIIIKYVEAINHRLDADK